MVHQAMPLPILKPLWCIKLCHCAEEVVHGIRRIMEHQLCHCAEEVVHGIQKTIVHQLCHCTEAVVHGIRRTVVHQATPLYRGSGPWNTKNCGASGYATVQRKRSMEYEELWCISYATVQMKWSMEYEKLWCISYATVLRKWSMEYEKLCPVILRPANPRQSSHH